jgi:hypothetical protein
MNLTLPMTKPRVVMLFLFVCFTSWIIQVCEGHAKLLIVFVMLSIKLFKMCRMPIIGRHYFWPGLIALPKNTLPIDNIKPKKC